MSIPKIDQANVLRLVSKALDYQFDCSYSWINMIEDIDSLTKAEKAWAKENISYKAYIVGEDVHT